MLVDNGGLLSVEDGLFEVANEAVLIMFASNLQVACPLLLILLAETSFSFDV